MLLDKAKKLLKAEYLKHYDEADAFGKYFMDEKIVHSYQVLGAGNYILEHEAIFQNCSKEEKDKLQVALLLHDVGRFYEAKVFSKGIAVDHGCYGADILARLQNYADIDIVLPVRHHGHLIDKLLNDEEYIALSSEKKKEIDKIIYLVMDADKIANFYLLARAHDKVEDLFFSENQRGDNCKVPNAKVIASYMKHELVHSDEVKNWADRALMSMACAYDIHYETSFAFLKQLNIIPKVLDWIRKYWSEEDAKVFVKEMNDYFVQKL